MRELPRRDLIDWYEILEVSHNASPVVIHAAYRALARESHPDRNPSPEAAQRIRQLNAAYRVLSNHDYRARYDLQCARVRRYERTVKPEQHELATVAESRDGEALTMRPPSVRRPVEESPPPRNPQVLIGLVVVATVVILLLALVAFSFGLTTDDEANSMLPVIALAGTDWASS